MSTTAETIEGREVMAAEAGMIGMLNKSEIDQQITTAKKYPRSLKRFRDEALQMVTLTEQIAKECVYALPRKDADGRVKTIEGPSARFGEIIASAWGNCRAGARVVNEGSEFVTAQGVFHDLERNVAITYEVQRRITTSKGKRYSADMVGVTANAACSIALRNAILKGVPKAFWSELYAAARRIIAGDVKTLVNRRTDAIKEFVIFGVSEAQILATLGKSGVQDIGIDDLVTLHGILTAIRDGDTTAEQAFSESAEGAGVPMPKAKSEKKPDAPIPEQACDAHTPAAAQPVPEGDDKPIMASPLALIRKKLEQAALTEPEVCRKFRVLRLEELTMNRVNSVLAWVTNPE